MIARLRGRVVVADTDHVVLETGGVGYQLLRQQQLFDMAGAMAWRPAASATRSSAISAPWPRSTRWATGR